MEDAMAKFFTYEERLTLQRLLKEGMSFKKIAAQIHKDPATISREVQKYAVEIATGKPGYSFNACKKRMSCKIKSPALCDYSGPPAHPGRSSAQPDRASAHLIRSAVQPMLAAGQHTC